MPAQTTTPVALKAPESPTIIHGASAIRALATGTTSVAAVYTRDLLKLPIVVPPRHEQVVIASALTDVDDLIATLKRVMSKKEAIKQGIMQALLTSESRLPGFSAPWTERSIGSLGNVYGGLTGKTKDDFGTGLGRYVPFLAVMTGVRVTARSLLSVQVAAGERQNVVRSQDLLFNASSETPDDLALCAVADKLPTGTYLNSFCFGFRIAAVDEAEPLFIAYLFRSAVGRRLMGALGQGAIRYNLSKLQFRRLVVSLPPVDEQRAIAAVLHDADNEIDVLRDRLRKADAIKQGMMQELLSGRTRLPVLEGAS